MSRVVVELELGSLIEHEFDDEFEGPLGTTPILGCYFHAPLSTAFGSK